jgi:long-chain-fatty-acid--[acyl-carrier-protein] ligase
MLGAVLSAIAKLILGLRYRLQVQGLEQLNGLGGVLVLPNHPAEIDPIILTTLLWNSLRPRPVVLESMYHLPFLTPLMKLSRAIPMADMEFESGPFKRRRIERALQETGEALQKGESILLYPSGRLSVRGDEKIGGNSGVNTLLSIAPNARIALIRTKGLYGSIFSKALTGGETPPVGATIARGASIILRNLLFWTPRRNVTVEIVVDPPDFPRGGDTLSLNRYLERFYNTPKPETATLVSYSCWRKVLPSLPPPADEAVALSDVPENLKHRIFTHVARVAEVSVDSVTTESKLGDDLGMDSLTIAELLVWLDREFEVNDLELSEIVSVGSLIRAAAGQLRSGTLRRHSVTVPSTWTETAQLRPQPKLDIAATLPEAFLSASLRMEKLPALGDSKVGVLCWDRLRTGVLMLARRIAEEPSSHIGVLFPASCAGSMVTMACMVAGKVPVLLNWTAGKRALLHACDSTNVDTILTARSFMDIVPTDLAFIEERFIFLEDIRSAFSLRDKIKGMQLTRESTSQIMAAFGLNRSSPDDPAVVLFTSGSEALPKGVPLSHRNIISNIHGILDAFHFTNEDVLLGFLPPFHSFGLTVCSLFPLVTGLRVAYHPNPNESRKIAKAVGAWRATLMAGTPTFLRSIYKAAQATQLSSLRAMVSGAERAPEELFSLVQAVTPAVTILEGYGITECAPVVSLTRADEPRAGVGRPLQGVSVKIVNPDTYQEVPQGMQGLVLISGPNVFSGYLDEQLDPFITINGDKWYNSGDLGRLEKNQLVITGRLKRFIKIAGEMVSLSAVEEALVDSLSSQTEEPSIAVLARGAEGDSRPQLVVFSAIDLTTEAANEVLRHSGFPHLVHISEVRKITAIPLLGSGKTNYQELKLAL